MKVQLFATCLVDALFPEIGEAVVEVLRQAGVDVHLPPDQTCCGQPAFNAGFRQEARRMAQYTIEVLRKTEGPIVIPSGSCASMIRHGYRELFAGDRRWMSLALAVSERTFELSEFLIDQLRIDDLGATYPGQLAYHPSCHLLRGLGVDRQPMKLLQSVRDATVTRLQPECCGFGGAFAIDFAEVSSEILKRKIQQITATGASTVVGCDVSCLMHIEGGMRRAGLPLRSAHLAQILANRKPGLR